MPRGPSDSPRRTTPAKKRRGREVDPPIAQPRTRPRAETAVSNYGDRCPSLGRRAKTNKRVPPVILDRLLVFLFGCLLHENSRSQAVRASSFKVDPNEAIRKRSSY
ncbi:hypothetical protein G5I_04732 [Acromyrmex echinatior]|uniref:Uncharacterized protein n=1 Tax=Acromyrmex echinatior TaxID=103372 RepID=F4WGF7_ACREC|nr:hypothetical protein G5I_04732 [Acromyrmex echinatior]